MRFTLVDSDGRLKLVLLSMASEKRANWDKVMGVWFKTLRLVTAEVVVRVAISEELIELGLIIADATCLERPVCPC